MYLFPVGMALNIKSRNYHIVEETSLWLLIRLVVARQFVLELLDVLKNQFGRRVTSQIRV